jgi:hypothetical protein
MAAGYPISRTDLDNKMGGLVVAVRNSLLAVNQFKIQLDDTSMLTDALLQAAPYSYSSGDTTQIRAAFTDLAKLYDISRAAATQSATNDFWFNAKHLVGLNWPS